MLLITAPTFIEAHSRFFKFIANDMSISASTAHPLNADKLKPTYCIIQKGNTLHCEYIIADRIYNRTDIKRLLKRAE